MKEGKWKEKQRVSLEELIQELDLLAKQLRQESFLFQETEFQFAPSAVLEKKLSLKDGRLVLDVQLSLTASAFIASESEVKEGGGAGEGVKSGKGGQSPFSRKRLKKSISAAWKELKKDIGAGGPVDSALVAELMADLKSYGDAADPEWRQKWDQCVFLMEECIGMASAGAFKAAQELIQKVDQLTKQCHKRFK